jgi:tetratricopeptide (TPR) repeat protein
MNFRTGAASLLGLAIILGGCAAGGGGGGGVAPQTFDEEDLPAWVLALPEGDEPRDNEHTEEAFLALFQAGQTADPARIEEFAREALAAAQAGMNEDPENAQSYFQAGSAYLFLDDFESAGQMFDRAEEIYPRYVLETEFLRESSWIDEYNLAVEYLMSEPAGAVPHLERAHQIYQGRPEAMLQLAAIYAEDGRTDQAIDLYGQSIDLIRGPRAQDVDDEEILAMWNESLEVALFNRGQLLFMAGRFDEAAEVYEDIVEMFPDDLMALSSLAAALVSAGETDRASALYDEILNRPDLDARDYFTIGLGFYEANDLVQAARAFEEAHARVPQDRETLSNLTHTLYSAENWEGLLDVARRYLEVDTHTENAFRYLIQALVQLDQQTAAVEVLEELEALPFDVDGLQMAFIDGGVAVAGQVTKRLEDASSSVRLRVHFYDVNGGTAGSEDLTVTLGEVQQPVIFQADLATNADVVGYRYEVLN